MLNSRQGHDSLFVSPSLNHKGEKKNTVTCPLHFIGSPWKHGQAKAHCTIPSDALPHFTHTTSPAVSSSVEFPASPPASLSSTQTANIVLPQRTLFNPIKGHGKHTQIWEMHYTFEAQLKMNQKHVWTIIPALQETLLRAGSPHLLPYTKQPPIEPTFHFFQNIATRTKICLHKEQGSSILTVAGFSLLQSLCQHWGSRGSFMEEVGPHCASFSHSSISSPESIQVWGIPTRVSQPQGPTCDSSSFIHPTPWTVPSAS